MKKPVLVASHLSYTFAQTPLFDDIGFSLGVGKLLQITGDNGRGKTTLLKILAGLLEPTTGTLTQRVDYSQLLYLPHQIPIKNHLKLSENILIACKIKGNHVFDIDGALSFVGLLDKKDDFSYQLSAGQKRRLGLASILVAPSQLLILDEPFTALDSKGQALTEALISGYLKKGGSVVFTSHHPVNIKGVTMREVAL